MVTDATLSPEAPGSTAPPLRRGDFGRVTREGRRVSGQWIGLYAAARTDRLVRAGFTAGRRVGGAVTRNRARRLLREAWRMIAGRVDDGVDLVFVARAGIERQKTADVASELESLLKQAGVIR